MKLNFTLFILFISFSLFGQKEKRHIYFFPTIDNQSVKIEEPYFIEAVKDSVNFEAVRFYISNVAFFQDENLIFSLEKKHHLIDLENEESMKIEVTSNEDLKFNKIKFNLGIDSLTNVSGVFGGDLDPTNGMYWTWQSGYINFKLEGVTASCPARHHRFQYHLGGYQAPFSTMQTIELHLLENDLNDILVNVSIDDFFEKINLKETYQVMSPNQEAVEMARLVASIFSIQRTSEVPVSE